MADGFMFQGADGSAAAGESPAAAPVPYIPVKAPAGAANGHAAAKPAAPLPVSPVSPETTGQPANPGQPGFSQTGQPAHAQQDAANVLRSALQQRNIEVPDGFSDQQILDEVVSLLELRNDLPDGDELDRFRQSRPMLEQYQQNLPAFSKWLVEQAAGQQQSQQQPAQPQQKQLAATQQQSASQPGFSFDLEPLEFDLPQVSPAAKMASKAGFVKFNPARGAYEAAAGNEHSLTAINAANELNAAHAAQLEYIESFRENPVQFAQRAVVPLLQKFMEHMESRINPINQAVTQAQEERGLSAVDAYFQKNAKRYFQVGEDGQPKVDLRGNPLLTPEGQLYAAESKRLEQAYPDAVQRHRVVLEGIEQARRMLAPQQQAPAQPAAPPVEQQEAPAEPAQPAANGRVNRLANFLQHSRQQAASNGNAATPHTQASPPQPTLFGARTGTPDFKAMAARVKAANS